MSFYDKEHLLTRTSPLQVEMFFVFIKGFDECLLDFNSDVPGTKSPVHLAKLIGKNGGEANEKIIIIVDGIGHDSGWLRYRGTA